MSSSGGIVVSGKEAEIILPPPSEKNPIPSLSAALRVDNQEQLLYLINESETPQLLIFGTESLRTLLLRQVLSDPHTRKWPTLNKNWDDANMFPSLPRNKVHGTALLDDKIVEKSVDTVTYFIQPTVLEQTQRATNWILQWKNVKTEHKLVYLPESPAIVHKMLQNVGLTGPSCPKRVSIQALQLDIFPLEADLFSLEIPDALREISVEGTPSQVITYAARSILKLQDVIGRIPRIQAYGGMAEEVLRKTLHMSVEEHLANVGIEQPSSDVSALVILDRKIDMVTPLLTPLTYEGLLDDVVGIDCCFLHVDEKVIQPESATSTSEEKKTDSKDTSKRVVALGINDADHIYAEIRDQHVEKFGSFLQTQAMALKQTKTDFSLTGKDKDLTELQKFVKNLPNLQQTTRSLTNHVYLADLIKQASEEPIFRERWQMERTMLEGDVCLDELDDLVAGSYPPMRFLRLLCLQSLCKNGINSSRYDSIRKDIVQTYGYEYLFVLANLEKANLLRRKDAFLGMETKPSPFSRLKDSLILINAEVDTVEPDDIAYVSSGYAPLTIRLLQSAVSGWKNGREEILRELPGRFIDITQQYPPEDLASTLQRPISTGTTYGSLAPASTNGILQQQVTTTTKKKPVLIVFYIGGVSYMELAALRFLSRKTSFPYHIICCTTKVMNGNSMIKSLSF